MNLDIKQFAAALVASIVFLTGAFADDEKRREDREPTNDKEFLAKAIACEIGEIKLAEMAKKQTKSPDVEKFADTIINDHTKMRDTLLEHAKSMKVAVVEGTEKEHKEKEAKFAKLTGAEFDREYAKCMSEGHEKAIKAYETWSKKSTDTKLADFVKSSIPTLKDHKKHADELATKLNK